MTRNSSCGCSFEQALLDNAEPGYDWALGGEEIGFSRYMCDGCGSRLHGDRYRINLLPVNANHGFDKTREIIPIDVCTDCLMAHANGDMPEEWHCGVCP